MFGDTYYVPGQLLAGKTLQLVFACIDGITGSCSVAAGDVFEFISFTPSFEGAVSFAMGPAPGFSGVDKCDGLPNAAAACGHVTIEQNARSPHTRTAFLPRAPLPALASRQDSSHCCGVYAARRFQSAGRSG